LEKNLIANNSRWSRFKGNNEKTILKIASFNLFLSFFLIFLAKNEIIFYLALTFMSLGNGLANPSIQAIASEDVPK